MPRERDIPQRAVSRWKKSAIKLLSRLTQYLQLLQGGQLIQLGEKFDSSVVQILHQIIYSLALEECCWRALKNGLGDIGAVVPPDKSGNCIVSADIVRGCRYDDGLLF